MVDIYKNYRKYYYLNSQIGSVYFWMISTLFFLSLSIGQWSVNYATLNQREKEKELLRIGLEYRNAIYQYYQASPNSIKNYPKNLEDLMRDPRYLSIKRYLRKLEDDPLTSKKFNIIRNNNGEIIGVFSSSNKKPIKREGFLPSIKKFNNAKSYKDWKFIN